jgi:TonB family protein
MESSAIRPPYPRYINFFRLRPELSWTIVAHIVLIVLILSIRWSTAVDTGDFVDLSKYELMELKIPEKEDAEEDVALPDEEQDEDIKLKFGDDSGKFDLSALAVTPPKPKIGSLPAYPDAMKKAGIEGVVMLEVGIDESGTVVYGKIVKKLHPVLDRLVITWARQVAFYPAIDASGKAFRCKIFWPIRFQLKS